MILRKLGVKFFATAGQDLTSADFIPVFQGWIRRQALDEILIDVADYGHVADGPGVLLACHDAHYMTDRSGRRIGLLYQRKTEVPGDSVAAVRSALRSALIACKLLQEDAAFSGRLSFSTAEFQLGINDRLATRNTEAFMSALAQTFSGEVSSIWGGEPLSVLPASRDPRERLGVHVTMPSGPPIDQLLSRLS